MAQTVTISQDPFKQYQTPATPTTDIDPFTAFQAPAETSAQVKTPLSALTNRTPAQAGTQTPEQEKEMMMGTVGPGLGSLGLGFLTGGTAPLVEAAAYPAIEWMLRARYSDKPEDQEILNNKFNLLKTMTGSTMANIIGQKIFAGAKNLAVGRNAAPTIEDQLGLTYAQKTQSPVAKWIEDNFATGAKKKSLANTQEAAQNLINDRIQNISGDQSAGLDKYVHLAANAETDLTGNLPQVNVADYYRNIIRDNRDLQKTLLSGNITGKVPMENARKELAGFDFADKWFNSYTKDAEGKPIFDSQRFMNQWNFPKFAQAEGMGRPSKDILYSKAQQKNIEEFTSALAKGTQEGQVGSNYLKMRVGAGVIGMTAGMAGSLATGASVSGAALGSGIGIIGGSLGLAAVGKMLLDKNIGPQLVKMAQGTGIGMTDRAMARIMTEYLKKNHVPVTFDNQDGTHVTGTFSGPDNKFNVAGNEIKIKGQ